MNRFIERILMLSCDLLLSPIYLLMALINLGVLVPYYKFKFRHQNALPCTTFTARDIIKERQIYTRVAHAGSQVREQAQKIRFQKYATDSHSVVISFREVSFGDERRLVTDLMNWCLANHEYLHEFSWRTLYDSIDTWSGYDITTGIKFYFQDADKAIMFKLLFGDK